MITKRPIYRVLTCLVLLIVMLRLSGVINFAIFDFSDRFSVRDLNVWDWYRNSTVYCGGNYTQYGHRFMKMNFAYFDPSIGQHFSVQCKGKRLPTNEWFHGYNHAPERYTRTLHHLDLDKVGQAVKVWKNTVIIVHRDYPHNFYHAMTQWFNIFILSKLFKFEFRKVDIIFLDNSPAVHLDAQWALLFGKVIKMKHMNTPVIFKEAIFSIPGHESPMYYMEQNKLQYVEEFSKKYLELFGLESNKQLNCSNLSVVLGIRRDYFMHPGEKRNTERKYKNEKEITETMKTEFKGHTVRTFIAEDMSLNEQLNVMTKADILIGMHGCIMTHAMFMPKYGAIFEMYPRYWTPQPFFRAIARWRGLKYEFWRNEDNWNEFVDHYTYIPSEVLTNYTRKIKEQMCGWHRHV